LLQHGLNFCFDSSDRAGEKKRTLFYAVLTKRPVVLAVFGGFDIVAMSISKPE